ncbi:MFS transporter [Sphingomonas chungangi]|uniref:MFS transporter n=1 Tax=Sphingomonas chungangi TaxID=2683589 RepID=UPI0031B60475
MASVSDQEVGLLDELPLSRYQAAALLMIAATVILDGLDNQMLGLAAPALLKEWGIAKSALGNVFALGFVGMGVGTLLSGWIGDRYGRRWALLIGVFVFGVATLASGHAASVAQIAMFKTVAGIGLGGVPGTAAAMIAEFTPKRWRSLAVTFGVVCVSLGGLLGGGIATLILPALGWRALFYCGGGATLGFVLLMLAALPESPRYLAELPDRRAELEAMLRRIGHPAPDFDPRAVRTQPAPTKVPMATLFSADLIRDTLALSAAMLSGMFLIYLMFNWAPTMLASAGFELGSASLGLTAFNLGGTVGAIAAAAVVLRCGSRAPLIVMALVGAGLCAFLATLPIADAHNLEPLLIGLCGLGLFGSAAQSAMFSVGTHAFPTAVRARGMGVMGAAGRVGALLSALIGAALIGAGSLGFFGALCFLMLVNAAGFVAVRNHVPPAPRDARVPALV